MNRKAALVLSSKLLPWAPEARSGWGAPGASINHDQFSHPEGREPRAQMWARPPDLPGRSPGDRAADRCGDGAWFWRSVGRGQRWKEARTVRVPEGTRCYKKFITRINIYNSGTLKLLILGQGVQGVEEAWVMPGMGEDAGTRWVSGEFIVPGSGWGLGMTRSPNHAQGGPAAGAPNRPASQRAALLPAQMSLKFRMFPLVAGVLRTTLSGGISENAPRLTD